MKSTDGPKKPKRGRGRPEERLVVDPAKAGEGWDRLLGKNPKPEPDSTGPRVSSKKPKAK